MRVCVHVSVHMSEQYTSPQHYTYVFLNLDNVLTDLHTHVYQMYTCTYAVVDC